jgi:hypothetical protein
VCSQACVHVPASTAALRQTDLFCLSLRCCVRACLLQR